LLTGLAHGTAGIAWSLQRLAAATGQHHFRECAREAILYERSLFLPDACAWRDTRLIAGATHTEMSWCWGAPGVGIARVAVPASCLDSSDVQEVEFMIGSLLKSPLSKSDCLCHGELGNIEFVLVAAERLGRAGWRTAAVERTLKVLDRKEMNGDWLGGMAAMPHRPPPGFMLGLAGIGFQLLRMVAPDRTASLLALEPPRSGFTDGGLAPVIC